MRMQKLFGVFKYPYERLFLLITFVGAVVAASVLFFAYFPATEEKARNEWEIQRLNAKISRINNFKNAHNDIEEYRRGLEENNARLKGMLPDDINQSEFMGFLHDTAQKCSVSIVAVTADMPYEENDIMEFPMELTLRGDYFALTDFFAALDDSPRFVRQNDLSIKSYGRRELEAKISLTIYSLKNP